MSTFADLTKDQQLDFTNLQLNHFMERRRLIQRYRSATSDEERTSVQSALNTKVAEEPTVDGYLGA